MVVTWPWKTASPKASATPSFDAGIRSRFEADYSAMMGGGQAVRRDFAKGVNYGASDPRKDGEAIPQPLPQH